MEKQQARQGDRVTINYTGTLSDGTVFDTTLDIAECSHDDCDSAEHDDGDCGCGCHGGPMDLTIGAGQLFPEIDAALVDMTPGQKKSVTIPARDAFGEYDEEKVFSVPRSDLPSDLEPAVGDELILANENDEELGVAVTAVDAATITFDANHPLAGEDLTFEVELVAILPG